MSLADWYLLLDGSDTPDCGSSELVACKTLGWLLSRFRNTSGPFDEEILSLMIDFDLTIDQSAVRRIPFQSDSIRFEVSVVRERDWREM